MVKELFEVLPIVEKIDREYKEKIKHQKPIVRKTIFEDIWDNTVNLFTNFSWGSFAAWFADFSGYFVMPLEGGYMKPYTHLQYKKDEKSYKDANVKEEYLFS